MTTRRQELADWMTLSLLGRISLIALMLAAIVSRTTYAQGIMGASVRGAVFSEEGAAVANARVFLTSSVTGNRFDAATRNDGSFFFENVPVGSYSLEARAIGMQPASIGGITVHLGDQIVRRLVMNGALAHRMDDVVIRGSALRDPGSGGTAYAIAGEAVRGLPLLDRNFTSLFTMSSQATGSARISVSGQQFRFNVIQVDGALGSDRFFSGTQPGDRVGAKSLSLESVAEITILVAPFDVRQGGFAGGLINAVTRSGTNRFQASTFFTQSGAGLAGPDTSGARIKGTSTKQFGFTVSGPIIRDKLHFFAVTDLQAKRSQFQGASASDPSTGISDSTARRAQRAFRSRYGFESGGPEEPLLNQPNYNFFGKLSWQPSPRHLIALTHTVFGGTADAFNRSARNRNNRDGWELSNSGSDSRLKSFTTQLVASSAFGALSNELITSAGASGFRSNSQNSVPLFLVQADLANTYLAGGSVKGAQDAKTDQRFIEFTDNLSWKVASHTLTFGTQNQLLHFSDSFFLGQWGVWTFGSVNALENRDPLRYEISLPLRPGGPLASYRAVELAGYLQDKWELTSKFSITAGMREDVPFFQSPVQNSVLLSDITLGNIDTRAVPSGNATLSPRLGFSYNFGKKLDFMLRGGVGGFASRPPYAWLSSAYSNTGQDQTLLVCNPVDGVPAPTADLTQLPSTCLKATSPPVPTVMYFDRNFRFEQTVKYVLGLDHQLARDMTLALDFSRTFTRNALFASDVNLIGSGFDSEARMMYGTIGTTGLIRPARPDASFGPVFRYEDRSADRSTDLSVSLDKRWESGGVLQVGYTWSRTDDLMSLLGNHGLLFFQNSPIDGTIDDRRLRRSARDVPHNLVATFVSPRQLLGVTPAFFFQMHSGTPYAYVVNGDANADGAQLNDLTYIPRDATDISLKNPQLYPALDSFIRSERCLNEQRGRVMARNTCRNPAVRRLDARLSRSIGFFRSQALQLSADVFNVANMLNHNWGLARQTTDTEVASLLGVAGWDAVNNRPLYLIPSANGLAVLPARKHVVVEDSRWRAQLGARYNF